MNEQTDKDKFIKNQPGIGSNSMDSIRCSYQASAHSAFSGSLIYSLLPSSFMAFDLADTEVQSEPHFPRTHTSAAVVNSNMLTGGADV